jgi:predicted nucleotidyltransferase
MKKTLSILNKLKECSLIDDYAIGGGIAVLFYVEPVFTSDLDIFCLIPAVKEKTIVSLSPIYDFLKKKGYKVHKEQIIIEGVPVQFIPAYNELIEDAVKEAKETNYEGIKTKVISLEHLLAIMLQTNRPKDRERIFLILDEADVKQEVFNKILKKHNLMRKWQEIKKAYDKK